MFRFTIRDVLWLTVVVAILAAWLVDRRQLNLKIIQLDNQLSNMGRDSILAPPY